MCFDFGKWSESPSVSSNSIACAKAVMNQVPNQLGVVLMIGENDSGEVFQLEDAEKVVEWARNEARIDWLSFWSINRDVEMWGRDESIHLSSTTKIKQQEYDFTRRFMRFQN
jgi:hypothetical protein